MSCYCFWFKFLLKIQAAELCTEKYSESEMIKGLRVSFPFSLQKTMDHTKELRSLRKRDIILGTGWQWRAVNCSENQKQMKISIFQLLGLLELCEI